MPSRFVLDGCPLQEECRRAEPTRVGSTLCTRGIVEQRCSWRLALDISARCRGRSQGLARTHSCLRRAVSRPFQQIGAMVARLPQRSSAHDAWKTTTELC